MAVLPATQARAGATLNLLEVNPIVYNSQPAYEYIYDIISDVTYFNYWIEDLDTSRLLNLHGGVFYDKWDASAAGYPDWGWATYPSLGDTVSTWTLNGAHPDPSLNNWHLPSEYVNDYFGWAANSWDNGTQKFEAVDGYNGLFFWYALNAGQSNGLSQTLRLVHLDGPWGTLFFDADAWGDAGNTVVGPGPNPGDLDGDEHVDDLDIDMLCNAIRTGSTNFDLFDISADGTTHGTDGAIDTLDLDFLVRFLVEAGAGNGTEYGDFNLDGKIDTTDLTRLATNYGADDWGWDDGNANRYIDTNIDNTDLTILATFYGFGGPDVVPEPASAGLLLLGASAVLRRRRKAKR